MVNTHAEKIARVKLALLKTFDSLVEELPAIAALREDMDPLIASVASGLVHVADWANRTCMPTQKIIETIRNKGGSITARDLWAPHRSRFRDIKHAERILLELTEAGLLKKEKRGRFSLVSHDTGNQ